MPLTETQVPKIALKNVNMPEAGLNKASSEATITTTTAPAVNPATPQNKNEERPRLVISAKPTRRAVPDFHCSSSSSLVSSDSENSAFSSATEPSPTIPRTFSEVNFARPLRSSRLRSILKRPRADTTDEDDNDAENSEDESDIDDSDLESAYVEDDDLGEAGPINPGEGEDEGEDEIEITLDLSDDESVASNEDLGLDIQFGNESTVTFSNKVEYFTQYSHSDDEEDEEPKMTFHEQMERQLKEREAEGNNVTISFEVSDEDMEMEMSLLRAHANGLATLPNDDLMTVVRSRTKNYDNDDDPHIVTRATYEYISAYLEKLYDAIFQIFPRLVTHEAYDSFVKEAGAVTSFNEMDDIIYEEGSADVQMALQKEITETLETYGVHFDEPLLAFVAGEVIEPLGRCAAETDMAAQMGDEWEDVEVGETQKYGDNDDEE